MKFTLKKFLISILIIIAICFIAFLFWLSHPIVSLNATGIVTRIEEKAPNNIEVWVYTDQITNIWFDLNKNISYEKDGSSITLENFLKEGFGSRVKVLGTKLLVLEGTPEFYPNKIILEGSTSQSTSNNAMLSNYSDSKISFKYPSNWKLNKIMEGKVDLAKTPINPIVLKWANWDDILTINCNDNIQSINYDVKKKVIIQNFDSYLVDYQPLLYSQKHNSIKLYFIKNKTTPNYCTVDYRVSGDNTVPSEHDNVEYIVLSSLNIQ